MPVEVYSTIKPASRFRAWATSVLLLVGAASLAASMARNGSGPGVLGDRIEPRGWDISFRLPSLFKEVDSDPERFSSTYRYQFVNRDGGAVELIIWRVRAKRDATPLTVCRDLLDSAETWFTILLGPRRTRTSARLGDREGLEVHNLAIPMIVRSTVLENGWAYAVSIRVERGPIDDGPPARIDEPLYRLFDLTCRAVQFKGDAHGGLRVQRFSEPRP